MLRDRQIVMEKYNVMFTDDTFTALCFARLICVRCLRLRYVALYFCMEVNRKKKNFFLEKMSFAEVMNEYIKSSNEKKR